MTISRIAMTTALFALFTGVTGALGVYEHRQTALTLEGNSLYSPDAVSLDADTRRIAATLERGSSTSGRIFVPLSDDGRVRVMATVGNPSSGIPLYEGRQPTPNDDRVVLAGSAVDLIHGPHGLRYVRSGISYDVVGRLGIDATSLVADQVLLIDGRLFDSLAQAEVIVDSPSAVELFRTEIRAGRAIPLASAMNQRTNIDFVSPILVIFGTALAMCGFVVTGALAGTRYRPRLAIAHLVGTPRWRALSRGLAEVIFILAPTVAAGLLFCSVAKAVPPVEQAVSVAATQMCLALASFVAGATIREWGKKR